MSDEELRALAEKATPGPWKHLRYGFGVDVMWDIDTHDENLGAFNSEEDAAYIAAASPDRILALLDRVDAARALHVAGDRADLGTFCDYDGEAWPCQTTAALSEPTTRTTDPEGGTR